MTQPKVKVGNSWLNLEEIKRPSPSSPLSKQEVSAIQFCHDWLSGKETFEFQTSGSTGTPKKITFRREQLMASARITEKALKLKAKDTALICLDTQLIAGAMMLVRCMVTGMNMIIRSPSANPLKGNTDPIDFAALVPYQVASILASHPSELKSIGTLIIGGAPISQELENQIQNFPLPVYATYGMTESITHIALQRLNKAQRQDFFECLDDVTITTDHRGCLVIHAAHLGAPVVTNDLVTILDSKRFCWNGRIDRIINSGGAKVSAEKIEKNLESVLLEIRPTPRFFVAGVPDAALGERVVLIVEGPALNLREQEKIRAHCSSHLDKYETPKEFLFTTHFLETASQKIDRVGTLSILLKK